MTRRRLRDGLVYLQGATTRTAAQDTFWTNQGRQLRPYDAVPQASAVFVDRTGAQFEESANQAWDIADNNALENTATGSITFLAYLTLDSTTVQWGAPILMKRNTSSAGQPGWGLYRDGTNEGFRMVVGDGTTDHLINTGTNVSYDTPTVIAGRWDGPNSTSTLFVNGTQVAQDTTTISGSGANTRPLRIAGDNAGNLYKGFLYDLAVFREALSDADIQLLTDDMRYKRPELRIGRITVDAPQDGLVWTGRGFQFGVDIHSTTLTGGADTLQALQALRAQFLGLQVGDVIPVYWSDDLDVNGWYQITTPAVVSDPGAYLAGAHLLSVEIGMVRVTPPHARAEQTQIRDVRTSSLTLTTADARSRTVGVGVPDLIAPSGTGFSTTQTEHGPVVVQQELLNSSNLISGLRYDVESIDGINGAAVLWDTSDTDYPVIGDVVHAPSPQDVMLSNGIVRALVIEGGKLLMERWDPDGGWLGQHTLSFTLAGNQVTFPEITPTVATNHPMDVTLVYPISTSSATGWEMAIRFRRATTVLELEFAGANAAAFICTMQGGTPGPTQAIAATPFEACIRTTNATDGYYGHLMSPEATGTASTSNTITLASATNHRFGLGLSTATTSETAQLYICAETFTERVTR